MFELRNENQVWYKSNDMIEWVHYGNTQIVEPCGENEFCIKKFNMDSGRYEVDTTVTTYNFNGTEYGVTDGHFTVPVEEETVTETLTEQEQAILETAVNVDYLVCMADMGV